MNNQPSTTGMQPETTAVYLSAEEARLFVLFQKHHKFIEMMEGVDAFTIKGGSITIHFDNLGNIGSVDIQRRYRLLA